MERENIIFLIESSSFNKDLMRLSLEKLTNYKVFNFFSFKEAALYTKLNPTAIVYSSDNCDNILSLNIKDKVDFIDISNKINQKGKDILMKHTVLADKLAVIINKSLN